MRRAPLLAFAAVVAACAGEGPTGPEGPDGCEPGATLACTCPDAVPGTAVCGEDRTPGPCACPGELRWSPAEVDFDELAPGTLREETLLVWTDGAVPLPVTEVRVEGDPGFSLVSHPAELAASGAAGTVVVSFLAEKPVAAEGTLVIRTARREATVPLRARAVGPAVECAATYVSFSDVPVGNAQYQTVACTNIGLPGREESALIRIAEVAVDDPEFAPWYQEGKLYGPGETLQVEFSYLPQDEEDDRATARITFDNGSSVELSLAGTVSVPPCSLDSTVSASEGIPGLVAGGKVTFVNRPGEAGCLLDRIEPSPDCHSGFTFTLPPDGTVIGPGGFVEVPFVFEDGVAGVHRCELRAHDRHGNTFAAQVAVELSYQLCLRLAPGPLDPVSPSCGPSEGVIELTNRCSVELPVDEVRLSGDGAEAFSLGAFEPSVLQPWSSVTVPVVFDPAEPGTYAATLEVRAEVEPSPWTVDLEATARADDIRYDRTLQERAQPLDVLVVIDNGVGMGPEVPLVLAELGAAPERLRGYDYHLAVTTTGLVPESGNTCPGGAAGGEDGRLFPVDASRPRVVTPTTPDARLVWEQNLQVGTCHSAPARPLEAAVLAVSSPLADAADDPRHPEENDGNLGFRRSGVPLVVIFVGDRDDASPEGPAHYRDALVAAAGGTVQLSVAVVAGSPVVGCTGTDGVSAAPGDRLHQFAVAAGAVELSLCHRPWGVLELFPEVLSECFPVLGDPADWNGDGTVDSADLGVRVVPDEVPAVDPGGERNWWFDTYYREVCFEDHAIPRAGAVVEVRRLYCP
jgi:hypothetical protein